MAAIKRPAIITALSVTKIGGVILSFPQILFPSIRSKGDFIPMIYGIIITLRFVSVIGIWHMKKWGVQFFIATFFMNVFFSIYLGMTGAWLYVYATMNVLMSIVFLRYYKNMANDL